MYKATWLRLFLLSLIIPAATAAAQATKPATAPATSASAPSGKVPTVTEQVVAGENITVTKLSNGLTVIVQPHRAAGVVSVRSYVHTGSMYEGKWLGCGLSHLVEHLVANGEAQEGSTSEAQKRLAQRVAQIGGEYNASTSIDYTNYYISAAAGKTNECIDLVAEWMTHPTITEGDFDREHGVVQRELEMGKDSPGRRIAEAHSQNVYGSHPAAVPTIGYAVPLRDLTFKDVLEYHAKMYVPSNMIFCVVGDVDPQAVLERVRQDFAGVEAARVPEHMLPDVKPVLQSRRVVLPQPKIEETQEAMSFLTIPLLDEDLYALDLLSTVVGEGPASRLQRSVLREKKLVTGISTGSYTPAWGKGDFEINFRCEPKNADAAEQAILAELKRVADEGVNGDELARAKRQKAADLVEQHQTVDSIAGMLASDYMQTRDVMFSTNYTKRIQEVTAEQVQAAAKKYFAFDRVIVTRMVPADKFALGAAATQATQSTAATVFTLPNGLRVVLQPVEGAGQVSMAMLTKGGLMLETPKTNGMGNLMATLSIKGAGKLSADQISEFFAQAGGSIGASCGNSTFSWQATVLQDSFDKALDIFADCILHPTYDPKELQIARPVELADVDKIEENWQTQMMRFFRQKFFVDCPYSLLPQGNKDVIANATADDIKAYHAKALKGGDSVLAIFGQFDAAAAKAKIEKLFAELPAGKTEIPECKTRKLASGGEFYVLPTKNEAAAAIAIGLPSFGVSNMEDKFPIDVLDTIISGWVTPGGWLHDELRGKQLVYVVHAFNWPGLSTGSFITYAACQPGKAPEVVSIIKKDLAKAADYKPTQEEINQAVNTILTAELLGNQSMSSLAAGSAIDELYGFGWDFRRKMESYYRKVTPDDVLRVGKKYFSVEPLVTVTTPQPDTLKAMTQPAAK